jgi:hypothetical protein
MSADAALVATSLGADARSRTQDAEKVSVAAAIDAAVEWR